MLLSLERGFHVGAFVFFFSGSRATSTFWLAVCCPTGVEDHEQMDIGVPQEPGRPSCFHVKCPAERPDDQLSVCRLACGGDGRYENEPPAHVVLPSDANRSEARRTAGNRSVLIVPSMSGNLPLSEDPAEESGTSHQTTDVGNYAGCSET
jgi:hypothetical protein